MRLDIADNLFTVSNLLGAKECLVLIERGEALGFEAASVSTAGGPKMMTNVRNNDRAIFDDPQLAAQLWTRIEQHVPTTIAGSVAVGLNERFRFYRYDPSQRFNAHRDGAVRRSSSERSRLTVYGLSE